MRLDKFLTEVGLGSRKEVKVWIKKGQIKVNNTTIKSDKFQVDELSDEVTFLGEHLNYQKYVYFLLNKPAGVLSATKDAKDKTVLDLLTESDYRADLFPVGRLDKNTEGLLLLTNDGELAHRLLSPKKHVEKEYYAEIKGIMTAADIAVFAKGMTISGGEVVQPAILQILSIDERNQTSLILLTIYEGKFHQVKRMVRAVGKEVHYLKRVRMGTLLLSDDLEKGQYRPLSEAEVQEIFEHAKIQRT